MMSTRRIKYLSAAFVVAVLGGANHLQYAFSQPSDPWGRSVTRESGADRYATAAHVALAEYPEGSDRVLLAAEGVDALAAGQISSTPLLLVPRCGTLPPVVVEAIARLNGTSLIVVGGEVAVDGSVVNQAKSGISALEESCSGEPAKLPGSLDEMLDKVGLAVRVYQGRGGWAVQSTVANGGSDAATFGAGYRLERRSEDGWKIVEVPPVPSPDVLFRADAGEYGLTELIAPWTVEGDTKFLKQGEYRLTKQLTDGQEIRAIFSIPPPAP